MSDQVRPVPTGEQLAYVARTIAGHFGVTTLLVILRDDEGNVHEGHCVPAGATRDWIAGLLNSVAFDIRTDAEFTDVEHP